MENAVEFRFKSCDVEIFERCIFSLLLIFISP